MRGLLWPCILWLCSLAAVLTVAVRAMAGALLSALLMLRLAQRGTGLHARGGCGGGALPELARALEISDLPRVYHVSTFGGGVHRQKLTSLHGWGACGCLRRRAQGLGARTQVCV